MRKTYRVDIVNRRNHKVLDEGLPAFDRYEYFNSVREAALAIYDRANAVIDRQVSMNMNDIAFDDNEDEWLDEHSRRMHAVLEEIDECEGWACNGIHYVIIAEEVGRVYRGTLSEDGNTICNAEPIAPITTDPYPRNEAALIVSDYCDEIIDGDSVIEEAPYGWVCEYKNNGGMCVRLYFSWIADSDVT